MVTFYYIPDCVPVVMVSSLNILPQFLNKPQGVASFQRWGDGYILKMRALRLSSAVERALGHRAN